MSHKAAGQGVHHFDHEGFIVAVMNPSSHWSLQPSPSMSGRARRNLARRFRWSDAPTPFGARREGGRFGNRFEDPFYPSAGVTPSSAVKRRSGIRLAPGGRRHAGAGVGL